MSIRWRYMWRISDGLSVTMLVDSVSKIQKIAELILFERPSFGQIFPM